jgi:hypothetical protein
MEHITQKKPQTSKTQGNAVFHLSKNWVKDSVVSQALMTGLKHAKTQHLILAVLK